MQNVFPRICRQLYSDQTPANSHWRETIQVQDMSAEVFAIRKFESAHARARTGRVSKHASLRAELIRYFASTNPIFAVIIDILNDVIDFPLYVSSVHCLLFF